jgi:hypothetical protein
MLYSIDSGRYVKTLPHKKDFDKWMKQLSSDDYNKIIEALNENINSKEIHTAGWIPGNDWTGTVYQPLYYACGQNKMQSGMFFGLILFDLLMRRTDCVWGFGKFEKDGVPIASMTYFLLDNPPPNN